MTPARNRVTPIGDIEAIPLRGAWTGNRGILHARPRDRPLPRERPLDHLRARVPRPLARAVAAAPLHVPVLPRRGGLLRRRASPVRASAGARATTPTARRGPTGSGSTPPSAKADERQLHGERIVRGTHRRRLHAAPLGRPPRRRLRRCSTTRPPSSSATSWSSGRTRATRGRRARPARGTRDRHHAAVDRCRAARRATRRRSTTVRDSS